MQTWMLWRSFGKTAEDLDRNRLKLQLRQTWIIFDILTGGQDDHPKRNHPAVKMWEGYEYALGIYGMMLGMEWSLKRGYAEAEEFWSLYKGIKEIRKEEPDFVFEPPPWMFDSDVLASHRSNLARRDPVTYGDRWDPCPINWPYLWPWPTGDGDYELRLSKGDKRLLKSGERQLPPGQLERIVNWP